MGHEASEVLRAYEKGRKALWLSQKWYIPGFFTLLMVLSIVSSLTYITVEYERLDPGYLESRTGISLTQLASLIPYQTYLHMLSSVSGLTALLLGGMWALDLCLFIGPPGSMAAVVDPEEMWRFVLRSRRAIFAYILLGGYYLPNLIASQIHPFLGPVWPALFGALIRMLPTFLFVCVIPELPVAISFFRINWWTRVVLMSGALLLLPYLYRIVGIIDHLFAPTTPTLTVMGALIPMCGLVLAMGLAVYVPLSRANNRRIKALPYFLTG